MAWTEGSRPQGKILRPGLSVAPQRPRATGRDVTRRRTTGGGLNSDVRWGCPANMPEKDGVWTPEKYGPWIVDLICHHIVRVVLCPKQEGFLARVGIRLQYRCLVLYGLS
jgi:hypothetical protein